MKTTMKNSTLIAIATVLVLSSSATLAGPGGASSAITIPDGDPTGITLGPLSVAAGAAMIQDVVVGLEIAHAYAGDLGLTLHYDRDNDGAFDASSAIDLHLARVGDCEAEELYGIPVELAGTYYFKDEGWLTAGEDVSFAATFDGQPGGGSFYLTVIDDGDGNTGSVQNWTITVDAMEDENLCRTPSLNLASLACQM